MRKFYFLPSLLIIIIIPVLIIISLITSNTAGKGVNTDSGESYLAAMGEMDIQSVQNNISPGQFGDNQDTEPESTQPPREDVTEPSREALVDDKSFYGSNLPCYVAYYFDEAQAESVAQAVADKTMSTKDVFKDTLFVGDSIMTGFSDFQFANKGNVIAEVGARLNHHLSDNIQNIINYNPKYVVIHYGINEMEQDESFLDKFINTYKEDLSTLQAALPNSRIMVACITPVKAATVDKNPRFSRVEAYNTRIRQMCVDMGISYVENSALCVAHPELYAADGIHMQKQMYQMWIEEYLIKEMGIY